MAHPASRRHRSQVAQTLSTVLFIAAIAFAGTAIYLWYSDDANPGPEPPPPAEQGKAELANVLTVLREQNSDWEYGRVTASTEQIDIPGQPLQLGDTNLYVFIFNAETGEEAIAAREAAAASIDLETLTITSPSGLVINEGKHLHMAQASNVITILVGGSDELAADVQAALANLP